MHDPGDYLDSILEEIAEIRETSKGMKSVEDYSANLPYKRSIEWNLVRVGEALSKLSQNREDLYDKVPHAKEIRGFRNIMVHNYAVIEDEVVWSIVAGFLDGLESTVKDLLKDL